MRNIINFSSRLNLPTELPDPIWLNRFKATVNSRLLLSQFGWWWNFWLSLDSKMFTYQFRLFVDAGTNLLCNIWVQSFRYSVIKDQFRVTKKDPYRSRFVACLFTLLTLTQVYLLFEAKFIKKNIPLSKFNVCYFIAVIHVIFSMGIYILTFKDDEITHLIGIFWAYADRIKLFQCVLFMFYWNTSKLHSGVLFLGKWLKRDIDYRQLPTGKRLNWFMCFIQIALLGCVYLFMGHIYFGETPPISWTTFLPEPKTWKGRTFLRWCHMLSYMTSVIIIWGVCSMILVICIAYFGRFYWNEWTFLKSHCAFILFFSTHATLAHNRIQSAVPERKVQTSWGFSAGWKFHSGIPNPGNSNRARMLRIWSIYNAS